MKIILHGQTNQGESMDGGIDILALKAAKSALRDGLRVGQVIGVRFESGAFYGVTRNKDSVSVWPQRGEA